MGGSGQRRTLPRVMRSWRAWASRSGHAYRVQIRKRLPVLSQPASPDARCVVGCRVQAPWSVRRAPPGSRAGTSTRAGGPCQGRRDRARSVGTREGAAPAGLGLDGEPPRARLARTWQGAAPQQAGPWTALRRREAAWAGAEGGSNAAQGLGQRPSDSRVIALQVITPSGDRRTAWREVRRGHRISRRAWRGRRVLCHWGARRHAPAGRVSE
jgi:hypothetical protein